MKLTLRTLLAYLDGMLEDEDTKAIEEKVKESDYARDLVERIRNVEKQSDLDAPAPSGKEMIIDPNRVAEYLDTVMPTQQVGDFEKTALQDDRILAELINCHHALKLVLNEPMKVRPKDKTSVIGIIREKIENAPNEPEEEPAEEASSTSESPAKETETAPTASKSDASTESKPTPSSVAEQGKSESKVPDYLRDDSEDNSNFVGIVGLFGALAAVILLVVMFSGPEESPVAEGNSETGGTPTTGTGDPDSSGTPDPGTTEPGTPETPATGTTESGTSETPDPGTSEVPDPGTSEPKPPTPGTTEPETTEPKPPTPGTTEPDTTEPKPPTPETTEPEKTEPKPAPELPKVQLGEFTSGDQILLSKSEADDKVTWNRLNPRSVIRSGDEVISLYSFRPNIALDSGLQVELDGGASVTFLAPDDDGNPQIKLLSGKLVFLAKEGGLKVRIVTDAGSWLATTGDSETLFAVEATLASEAGVDPAKGTPQVHLHYYVNNGGLTLADAENKIESKVPGSGSLSPKVEASGDKTVPSWLQEPQLTSNMKRASSNIESEITPNDNTILRLRELADDRRIETRTLAMSCLNQLGDFEDAILGLKTPDLAPSSRDALVQSFQQVVALGPGPALALQNALVEVRGEETGAILYRILWGYSSEQLDDGGYQSLIDLLDNDELDVRVLAFDYLKSKTKITRRYIPDMEKADRAPAIQRWQTALDNDSIIAK